MTRVLFVAGAGRSGSTVVANALGSAPEAVSVGELRFLWERGVLEDRLCGCGEKFSHCSFWGDVMARASADVDAAGWHRRLTSLTRMRQLPRVVLTPRRWRSQAGAPELRAQLTQIYDAIAEVSGAQVVVDSSKLPTFALLLGEIPGLHLRILHLVRDPRAVAYAWTRIKEQPDRGRPGLMERRGVVKSSVLWVVWNSVLLHARARSDASYGQLRYEDFSDAPEDSLLEVGRWAGIDVAGALPGGGQVDVRSSHTVAGNPSRLRHGPTAIARDDAWITSLSPGHRRVVWVLTGWLARRFGYRSTVGAGTSSG